VEDGPNDRVTVQAPDSLEFPDSLEVIHALPPDTDQGSDGEAGPGGEAGPAGEAPGRRVDRRRTVVAAAVTGVVVVCGGALGGWQLTHRTTAVATGRAPGMAGSRVAPDRITTPAAGALIPASVLVQGVAADLAPGDALWLFDHDPKGGYIRDSMNPIPVSAGRWFLRDDNLTTGGLVLVLVRAAAGSACAAGMAAMTPDSDGTYYVDELPTGCAPADLLDVTVR
jgi:hypothetical protein